MSFRGLETAVMLEELRLQFKLWYTVVQFDSKDANMGVAGQIVVENGVLVII